ncbi:hypothetical protein [Desulfobacterium sp. N47]|uniref:Uncharacterized protein n=1 Tax=uncultured Desulfobacterium sp. TaxID=201089 RepID=E1YCX0_9BACT|nr:unknown protein [uncultured Desulfobacterium sp.]
MKTYVFLFLILSLISNAFGQETKDFIGEGYSIAIPNSWKQQPIKAPNGEIATLFVGNKEFGSIIESTLIDKKLMPTLARSSAKQKRQFIMHEWDLQTWLKLYPNLASLKDFRVLVNTKTILGKDLPASMIEYIWVSHENVCYHTRMIYSLSSKRQFSFSFSGFGCSTEKARLAFEKNVGALQKVQYSFRTVR